LELWQGIVLSLAGCIAGFLNVMAGGGSLITMPILVFMGEDGTVANGTNRVAILLQNLVATAGFAERGLSDFKLSLSLGLCALPGAILGAYVGTRVGGVWFNRILAGVLLLVLFQMSRKKKRSASPGHEKSGQSRWRRVVQAHLLMVGTGFYGGVIQAGVGFILMAVLHGVLGLDLVRVNMHKVFIVGLYTLAALLIFAIKGQVLWSAGLVLAVGNALGGWIATRLALKKGEGLIRWILYVTLLVMAIKLVLVH
jgi:uncharacterized membrane protein YfcA